MRVESLKNNDPSNDIDAESQTGPDQEIFHEPPRRLQLRIASNRLRGKNQSHGPRRLQKARRQRQESFQPPYVKSRVHHFIVLLCRLPRTLLPQRANRSEEHTSEL